MSSIHDFAARQLEKRLREVTNRFPLTHCYDVAATDAGFKVTFEVYGNPEAKKTIMGLTDMVHLTIPYGEFDRVVAEGLNVYRIVREFSPENYRFFDEALAGNYLPELLGVG